MNLFEHLDAALLMAESSTPRVSREAALWPSSASAELYDTTESTIVGKCHRAEIFKMIGAPQTNPVDPTAARRFRMGRACEADVTQLAKDAGVFVASGVRVYVADINMSFELDLVVFDPESSRGVIVEAKSIYGFYANGEVIKKGKPKREAVMQLLTYLNEVRSGVLLKDMIRQALVKKQSMELKLRALEGRLEEEQSKQEPDAAKVEQLERELLSVRRQFDRQRIEVNEENLAKMSDGPLAGKLVYESRDECDTREFDVAIYEDPVSHKHFPQIDGEPYRWFDVEGMYQRWRLLKERFEKMRDEAQRQLKGQGIEEPGEGASYSDSNDYWERVGNVMRSLSKEFLPPAEYEWKYSDAKIEACFKAGVISKTKYTNWTKGKKGYEQLGAWQCSFCGYKQRCLPMEYPELQYMALSAPQEDEAA